MSSSSRQDRHSDPRSWPPGNDLVESIQSAVIGAITSVLAPMLQNQFLILQHGGGKLKSLVVPSFFFLLHGLLVLFQVAPNHLSTSYSDK